MISACGFIAPVIHHLRPLMTYSSPSRTIEVAMLVASEEATSGSVIAKDERISPASSGVSQRSFCSGVPNIVSTSMLPVSGAEQLIAAGASRPWWPVISASGAYCRLVRPAPRSPCSAGRNRFHRPRERASVRSSSSTGMVDQAHRSSADSSWEVKISSAGTTCVRTKSHRFSYSSRVVASSSKSIGAPSSWCRYGCGVRAPGPGQASEADASRPAASRVGTDSPTPSKPSPTVWPSW